MIGMIIAAAGTAVILLLGEYLWRKRILKGEFARKFVHVLAATFAAFWPLFVPRVYIVFLSLVFIAVLIIVKRLKLFKSIHSVQRATYGEIWYALSIGAMAVLFKDNAVYAIAIMHLAWADGLAAVTGVGLNHKAGNFRFFGSKKSLAGTFTFIVVSFILNVIYWTSFAHFSITEIYSSAVIYSFLSSFILAFTELLSPSGSDNVIVPLMSGTLLWLPSIIASAT